MKKITVILPLYELCSDVKRAVLSIKRQSIGNEVELIIVDFRKFKAPKGYDKCPNGNVPDFVKTDKKIAKIKKGKLVALKKGKVKLTVTLKATKNYKQKKVTITIKVSISVSNFF